MKLHLKQSATLAFAIICLLLGFGTSQVIAQGKYNSLWSEYESHLQKAEVTKNKNQTLSNAISGLETENQDLRSLIAELKTQEPEIRYITRTETVIVAKEPSYTTSKLPEEYLFILEPELVVARFRSEEKAYFFDTFDLNFRNLVVISDNKTSASLQVSTTYDDTWNEVPVDIKVSKITEQPLFEPHIGLGISVGTTTQITGTLLVSSVHPAKNIDVLTGRIGINNQVATLGLDPISYNIGSKLPVLTDLWISTGPSINTQGLVSLDLTVGSKF